MTSSAAASSSAQVPISIPAVDDDQTYLLRTLAPSLPIVPRACLAPVTELVFTHQSRNLIAASGSLLTLYQLSSGRVLDQCCVFGGQRVHGLRITAIAGVEYLVAFGGKEVAIMRLHTEIISSNLSKGLKTDNDTSSSPQQQQHYFTRLWSSPTRDDMIWDVRILQSDPSSSSLITDAAFTSSSFDLAIGYAHDRVECISFEARLDSNNKSLTLTQSALPPLQQCQCEDRSLLYSMYLHGTTRHNLLVIGGTVFSHILVWDGSCTIRTDSSSPVVETRKVLHRIKGHDGVIFRMDVNADATKICSVSDDRTVRVWKWKSSSESTIATSTSFSPATILDPTLGTYQPELEMYGHKARVWRCAMMEGDETIPDAAAIAPESAASPSSSRPPLILSSSEDNSCLVWSTSGSLLAKFSGQRGGLWALGVDPKRRLVATGAGDASVRVWSLDGVKGGSGEKKHGAAAGKEGKSTVLSMQSLLPSPHSAAADSTSSPSKIDSMIIQSTTLLTQLDTDLTTFTTRLYEWYGWHWPELQRVVDGGMTTIDERERACVYAKLVKMIGDRSSLSEESLPQLTETCNGDATLAHGILDSSRLSVGGQVSTEDLTNIITFSDRIISLMAYRLKLISYLSSTMQLTAPNLTASVGEMKAAQLITNAGGLKNLVNRNEATKAAEAVLAGDGVDTLRKTIKIETSTSSGAASSTAAAAGSTPTIVDSTKSKSKKPVKPAVEYCRELILDVDSSSFSSVSSHPCIYFATNFGRIVRLELASSTSKDKSTPSPTPLILYHSLSTAAVVSLSLSPCKQWLGVGDQRGNLIILHTTRSHQQQPITVNNALPSALNYIQWVRCTSAGNATTSPIYQLITADAINEVKIWHVTPSVATVVASSSSSASSSASSISATPSSPSLTLTPSLAFRLPVSKARVTCAILVTLEQMKGWKGDEEEEEEDEEQDGEADEQNEVDADNAAAAQPSASSAEPSSSLSLDPSGAFFICGDNRGSIYVYFITSILASSSSSISYAVDRMMNIHEKACVTSLTLGSPTREGIKFYSTATDGRVVEYALTKQMANQQQGKNFLTLQWIAKHDESQLAAVATVTATQIAIKPSSASSSASSSAASSSIPLPPPLPYTSYAPPSASKPKWSSTFGSGPSLILPASITYPPELLKLKPKYKTEGSAAPPYQLLLGSKYDALNVDALVAMNVKVVLNFIPDIIGDVYADKFKYHCFPDIDDDEEQLISHLFEQCADIIKAQLAIVSSESGSGAVLVHCAGGVSRSVSIVIAYLMREYRWTYQEAFKYVQKCRKFAQPNVGFVQQLLEWQKKLGIEEKEEEVEGEENEDELSSSSSAVAATTAASSSAAAPNPILEQEQLKLKEATKSAISTPSAPSASSFRLSTSTVTSISSSLTPYLLSKRRVHKLSHISLVKQVFLSPSSSSSSSSTRDLLVSGFHAQDFVWWNVTQNTEVRRWTNVGGDKRAWGFQMIHQPSSSDALAVGDGASIISRQQDQESYLFVYARHAEENKDASAAASSPSEANASGELVLFYEQPTVAAPSSSTVTTRSSSFVPSLGCTIHGRLTTSLVALPLQPHACLVITSSEDNTVKLYSVISPSSTSAVQSSSAVHTLPTVMPSRSSISCIATLVDHPDVVRSVVVSIESQTKDRVTALLFSAGGRDFIHCSRITASLPSPPPSSTSSIDTSPLSCTIESLRSVGGAVFQFTGKPVSVKAQLEVERMSKLDIRIMCMTAVEVPRKWYTREDAAATSSTSSEHHLLVAGDSLGFVRFYLFSSSTSEFRLLFSSDEHHYTVLSVAHCVVSNGEEILVFSGSTDGVIKVWSVGEMIVEALNNTLLTGACTLSPNITASLTPLLSHQAHQSGVDCMAVTPLPGDAAGFRLFSGGDDEAIFAMTALLDTSSSEKAQLKDIRTRSFPNAHSSAVKSMCIEGARLYSVGYDQRVRAWQIDEDAASSATTPSSSSSSSPPLQLRSIGSSLLDIWDLATIRAVPQSNSPSFVREDGASAGPLLIVSGQGLQALQLIG